MPQTLNLKAAGLYTFPNQISEVPPGGLFVANNVVIDREGVLEPRRGYFKLPGVLGVDSMNRAAKSFAFGSNILSHYGDLNSPDTLAFYAPEVEIAGVETSSSTTLSGLTSVDGLYVGQYIVEETLQQTFVANVTLGSNTLTNVSSNQGIYVGQTIGGYGIPASTTITAITGTTTFTVTMSQNALATLTGGIFTASNSNLFGFTGDVTISAIGSTTITLSNNATRSSRTISFTTTDVDVSADTITLGNHGLLDGQPIQFSSTVTLPAPLVANTQYYVSGSSTFTIKVSATDGGEAIDLTTQGSGAHTLTVRNRLQAYGWIDYSGSYSPPDSTSRMRSVQANSNLYLTSSAGILKLDSFTATPTPAGAPPGLDVTAVLAPEASGFMASNTQVAYRVLWGIKDANSNLILGVPSQRALVANNGENTKDVELTITIPTEVTTSYFFQVYRSGFSSDAETEPDDEMSLIYEANPSSGEITAKSLTITDRTPESLRTGATLYTSPSQEGIGQANDAPPFSKDVTLFKGSTFYANTRSKQNVTLTILSVSGQFSIKGDTTTVSADTPTTIKNLAYTVTGDTTSGLNTITNVSDVSNLSIGQGISGSGIPTGSVITEIVSSTSIKINNTATATASTVTLTLEIVGVLVGQIVSGTGIPVNTTVTQVYEAVSATGDTSSGSAVLTNLSISASSFALGQPVTGTGIPAGTVVLSNTTGVNSITLSKNASATGTAVTLSFGSGIQISNAATATNSATTLTFKNGNNGIQVDDIITIDGVAYTAKLVENIASKQFKVFSQGTPSQNIADTANSLVRVVNRTTSPTPGVYAYYQSGFSSLPGKILFKERSLGGSVFYITASGHGSAYSPNLPTSGNTVFSSSDTYANGLYFSKTNQPEAVPLTNFTRVGTANAPILRVIPLRDSLFIFKGDGIFRLTGEDPSSFRVDLFDSTSKLLAAESAVPLNNQIFALIQSGVVIVSDTSVEAVSRYIEDKFLDIFEQNLSKVENLSFGISYESDRKYILFTITSAADTTPTQAYVWNTFTQTWTRWVLSKTCGIVHPLEDVLYLGDANISQFFVERKDRLYTDYVDDSFDLTLTAVDGNTLTLDSVTDVSVGDVMWQTSGRFSLVTDVDSTTSTVTVKDSITSWTLGSIVVLEGIDSRIEYAPQTAKNPGAMKQFREATLLFQIPFFTNFTIGFDTDLSGDTETNTLSGQSGSLWGFFNWGEVPWGGSVKPLSLRTYVPQQKQRCSLLNVTLEHNEAYSFYRLNGISLISNDLSERVGR
jgi:hypothetical protein